jgi:hypothetical protein
VAGGDYLQFFVLTGYQIHDALSLGPRYQVIILGNDVEQWSTDVRQIHRLALDHVLSLDKSILAQVVFDKLAKGLTGERYHVLNPSIDRLPAPHCCVVTNLLPQTYLGPDEVLHGLEHFGPKPDEFAGDISHGVDKFVNVESSLVEPHGHRAVQTL